MPPAELPDYYEILEVSRRASPETIKAAWRALCKKYHPDTHGGNAAQAEEAVKKLNEAYRVLGDAQRRAAYDSALNRPTAPPPSPRPSPVKRENKRAGREIRLFLLAFGAALLVFLALMLLVLLILL